MIIAEMNNRTMVSNLQSQMINTSVSFWLFSFKKCPCYALAIQNLFQSLCYTYRQENTVQVCLSFSNQIMPHRITSFHNFFA